MKYKMPVRSINCVGVTVGEVCSMIISSIFNVQET